MVLLPPFDLHVLGLPLAFILSQDQTLHCKKFLASAEAEPMSSADPTRIDELISCTLLVASARKLKQRLPICLSSLSKNVY